MLRGLIGADKFQDGLREYYRRYRDANASTTDLLRVMEETSGQNLKWFFEQWLQRPGSPSIEGGWTYDANTRKLSIDLAQTQRGAYRLPLEISIAISGESPVTQKLELTGATQHYEYPFEKSPSAVELDPNVSMLAEINFTRKSPK
jgi:aminopeptidase N